MHSKHKRSIIKETGFLLRRDPIYMKCPSCGEQNTIHKSRTRTFIETAINAVSLFKLYRCKKCGWRGYLPTII